MLDSLKEFSLAAGFTLNIPIIFAGNALNSLYDNLTEKMQKFSSGDGILARDINEDKEINNGAELFGNFTKLKNGELAKNGAEAGEITLSDRAKISA